MHVYDVTYLFSQVSSVSDHVAAQDSNPKSADFDDDDGGGLVSYRTCPCTLRLLSFSVILVIEPCL